MEKSRKFDRSEELLATPKSVPDQANVVQFEEGRLELTVVEGGQQSISNDKLNGHQFIPFEDAKKWQQAIRLVLVGGR